MRSLRLLLALLCAVSGCGRIGFDDAVLVVTRTDDRNANPAAASVAQLPPGTVGLSLREAVAIANNHPGHDEIAFDAGVFAAAAPATIRLGEVLSLADDVVIDATARVVVVDREPAYDGTLVVARGAGVTVRGIGFAAGGTAPRVVISGAGAILDALRFAAGGPPIEVAGANTTIVATTIAGSTGNGIALVGASGARLDQLHIAGVDADPIFISKSSDLDIGRCLIEISDKTLLRGIRVEASSRVVIHDNVIDPGPAQLISLLDSSDNQIIANVLDGGTLGIGLFGTSSRNLVFRNAIMASTDEPIAVEATASANRIINTTIIQTTAIVNDAADTEIANTLETSALDEFANPATYDFRLRVGSPSVDQGIDVGLDMLPDRPERFLGKAPDLGAVESF